MQFGKIFQLIFPTMVSLFKNFNIKRPLITRGDGEAERTLQVDTFLIEFSAEPLQTQEISSTLPLLQEIPSISSSGFYLDSRIPVFNSLNSKQFVQQFPH